MSFTFDTMQTGVLWLEKVIQDAEGIDPAVKEQAHDVSRFLRAAIDGLHDESHKQQDALNRGRPGIAAERLETALKHPDAEERAMWLRVRFEKG